MKRLTELRPLPHRLMNSGAASRLEATARSEVKLVTFFMMLYLPGNPGITRMTGKTCQKAVTDEATRTESNFDVEEMGLERNGATRRVVTQPALFTASLMNPASGTYKEIGAS